VEGTEARKIEVEKQSSTLPLFRASRETLLVHFAAFWDAAARQELLAPTPVACEDPAVRSYDLLVIGGG